MNDPDLRRQARFATGPGASAPARVRIWIGPVAEEILGLEARRVYGDPCCMQLRVPKDVQPILRRAPEPRPDRVNRTFAGLNRGVYVPLQGPR